ncbi:MAG TPA: nucleotide sugar dehydrogenase [Anaerolineales bacterium]|nr:nucleotide sugar dehydrogenase [Anaerolineales bacterium]
MTDIRATLERKLRERSAKMAVLGLGYVGLPFATVFAESGFEVIGIDPDPRKAGAVNAGESYIGDIESRQVAKLVNAKKLRATTDFSELAGVEAVSICVPTPLRKTGDPDLSFIVSATEKLAEQLHPGMVIVLESTTYPGTTRELMLDMLASKSGLKAGEDFFLAFSPERVDPGRKDWTTVNMPKVVGGVTKACGEVASLWYSQALKTVVSVSSAEVAEMAKLLENTFRMVNVGLVNEMALMCNRLGIDVWEVIDAAATKPFGFMKFTPGPGLGGHCIPIDPLYLSWKLKELNYTARFIELASEINTSMPRYVVGRVQDALNEHGKSLNGSKVLVLGTAYKPDIDDLRESPALDVIALLREKKADVAYHDPHILHIDHEDWALDSVPNYLNSAKEADVVVIITNHKAYDYPELLKHSRLIFDSRNAFGQNAKGDPKVVGL